MSSRIAKRAKFWPKLAIFKGRGSKNRFIGMSRSKKFIGGGRPYREDHFELLYAPLALTYPVGSQNEQNFGQNWPFLKGGGPKIDL